MISSNFIFQWFIILEYMPLLITVPHAYILSVMVVLALARSPKFSTAMLKISAVYGK